MTEEMAGWHHQFNGHELGQTLREVRDREASVSGMLQSRGSQRVIHNLAAEQQHQFFTNVLTAH